MSNYALIIIAENNYINNYYVSLCIVSFLDNNKWFDGDIVFFEDDECNIIDDKNKDKLRKLYNKIVFKKIDFNKYYKDICEIKVDEPKLYHGYPKLEVFRTIEYNKILCIDGDILFNGSVEELFKQNISMGVTSSLTYFDKNIPFDQVRNMFNLNDCLIRDSAGFNCGVIYFGNNDFINEETYKQLIDFIYDEIIFNDKACPLFEQHILNEFFKKYYRNQITWLSPIYNMAIYTWNTYIKSNGKYLNFLNTESKRINEALDKGIIFHLMSKNDIRLWANDRVINLFKKYICQITQ